ncbi:hypothetical protein BH11BAC3_BH11BAC3_04290 [soil metagenome]
MRMAFFYDFIKIIARQLCYETIHFYIMINSIKLIAD